MHCKDCPETSMSVAHDITKHSRPEMQTTATSLLGQHINDQMKLQCHQTHRTRWQCSTCSTDSALGLWLPVAQRTYKDSCRVANRILACRWGTVLFVAESIVFVHLEQCICRLVLDMSGSHRSWGHNFCKGGQSNVEMCKQSWNTAAGLLCRDRIRCDDITCQGSAGADLPGTML